MTESGDSITEQLARWASGLRFGDLSESAVHATCRAWLDWYGSTAAGSRQPPAVMARRAVAATEMSGPSTLLGGHGSAPADRAAFANGVACHILELDDLHQPSTIHPAAPIISAAVAVAEARQSNGADLIVAIAAGFEVALRIGEAVNPSHYRYWHPTGTIATFGAATSAGLLMGLSAEQLAHALGSAGTQAAGLWEFNADGSMSKHLHPGHAALAGVLSANLASAGFTGAPRILEGERGVFRAMAENADAASVVRGLGQGGRLRIEDNTFKRHPCCGHTHSGIDLALDLHGQVSADAVESVDIHAYRVAMDIVPDPAPETPYQARFSYPYVVAHALLHGTVTLDSFTPEHLAEDAVRKLMARVRLHHAPAMDADYPDSYPACLVVTTRDGRRFDIARQHPKGTPADPLTDDELTNKAAALIGRSAADTVRAHAFSLPGAARVRLPVEGGGA